MVRKWGLHKLLRMLACLVFEHIDNECHIDYLGFSGVDLDVGRCPEVEPTAAVEFAPLLLPARF